MMLDIIVRGVRDQTQIVFVFVAGIEVCIETRKKN
jgi:hypothetical protein